MGNKFIERECNICGILSKLTNDHVPPKCCKNRGNIRYYNLFENVINDPSFKKRKSPRIYQNGIYFKTICAICNNEILGKKFDPYLGQLTQSLYRLLNSTIKLPNEFHICVKPNRVCRSIVGHFLAASNKYNKDGEIEILLRNYFMNTTMDKIKDMHLYYWIHPFNSIAIIRNIGIWGDPVLNNSIVSIIKFPPIAFMLCNNKINDGIDDFFEYTSSNIDDEVNIRIKSKSFIRPNGEIRTSKWPFVPDDNRVFIVSDNERADSVFTVVDIN